MRHLTRLAASVAAGLLATATLAAPAEAAPADRGAAWLVSQLDGGLIHNDQYDVDDYALTADTALALDEIGGQRDAVRQIRRALARNVEAWTTSTWEGTTTVYAGSVAKAVVTAQATGGDPRAFGGVDLVRQLNQLVSQDGPTTGRVQDSNGEDYANTVAQAFAARGLANAGSPKADEVVGFLLQQQCPGGWFRLYFAAKTESQQGCDPDAEAGSEPDTDATALAVVHLAAMPREFHTSAVRDAIVAAKRWLKRTQKQNGSFGGGGLTPEDNKSNSNSTGLAAWALGETGACAPAARAAGWVRKLQVSGDVAGTPLAGHRGAIAYDRAAYEAAREYGIPEDQQDQWRRATTQAAPGLRYSSC